MKKDIIILAAGIGSRLRPLTDEVPKCLVTVNGEAILERVLKQIDSVSTVEKNIFIVTGYKSEVLKEFVDRLGIKVNYVDNADYNTTNNMYSLNLALKKTDEEAGLIIINADCFYDDEIVNSMLSAEGNFIAIDKSIFNEESMKVKTDIEGIIIGMSKAFPEDQNNFVSMDIYSFDKEFKKKLYNTTSGIIDNGDLNSWTEVALDILSRETKNVRGYDFSNRGWMEIDDHQDLKKAEQIFKKTTAE